MPGRISAVLVAMLVLSLSGGHFVAFQLYAWGEMLVVRVASGQEGALTGLFDEESRCSRCVAIEENVDFSSRQAKESEKAPRTLFKIEMALVGRVAYLPPVRPWVETLNTHAERGRSLARVPEVPPPRGLGQTA